MKKTLLFIFTLLVLKITAQETTLLFKEATNLEYQFKEQEALDKYKAILVIDPANIKALVNATVLSTSIGERSTNKNDKQMDLETAMAFAKRTLAADSANADAFYAMSLASYKMAAVESDHKKMATLIRDTKYYADGALRLNSHHALANFIEGQWHYEMSLMSFAKRAAIKTLFGGLPNASLDSAIQYFEKSRTLDPYLLLNMVTLAKAYKATNKPAKEMEILLIAVKLPIRKFDDNVLKADAQKRLQALQ